MDSVAVADIPTAENFMISELNFRQTGMNQGASSEYRIRAIVLALMVAIVAGGVISIGVVGSATAVDQDALEYGPAQIAPDQIELTANENWSHLDPADFTVYDYADRSIAVSNVTTDNAGHTLGLTLEEPLIGGDAELEIQDDNRSIQTASEFFDLSAANHTADPFAGEHIAVTNIAPREVLTIEHPDGERDRGAGQNSTVRVIDTSQWNAGDEITITGDVSDNQVSLTLWQFEVAGEIDREVYQEGQDIEVTGAADRVQRSLLAVVRDDRGEMVDREETATDVDGQFTASLTAGAEGTYTVSVVDKETWISHAIADFVVGPPEEDLTFVGEIPNDGDAYGVGVPGDLNGTLDDAIDSEADGFTVFLMENGEWRTVTDVDQTDMSGLDAFVVTTQNESRDDSLSVSLEFEETPDASTPPVRELERGWHVVSAPMYHEADTVFGIEEAFLVLDRFAHPESTHFHRPAAFDTHFIGNDASAVSPFTGYLLYVEGETALPGVLSAVETRSDVIEQLDVDLFAAHTTGKQQSVDTFAGDDHDRIATDAIESPPLVPASYYGTISLDGEPVPAGVQIEAVVDGEVRDQTTITDEGSFGGPAIADEKLTVSLDENEAASDVEFSITGEDVAEIPVTETITWESGAVEQLTLTAQPAEPSILDYTTDEDVVETDNLRSGVSDWRSGHISTELLREIVAAWRSGHPVW